MQTLQSGESFPAIELPCVDGGRLTLGVPRNGRHDWQMIVVYRGLHCPLCKDYLRRLEELLPRFHDSGVEVVAVSGDPQDRARAMVEELNLSMPMAHDLSVEQMKTLGLFISEPRSPQETDRPFPEPALFVSNGDHRAQIVEVSNAPCARPDLEQMAHGLEFIRANNYPVRGTYAA